MYGESLLQIFSLCQNEIKDFWFPVSFSLLLLKKISLMVPH